jgi:hypothetical protein
MYAKHDAVIKDPASIHHALRPTLSERKVQLREILKSSNKNDEKYLEAQEELMNLKDCKVRYDDQPDNGFVAHNAPLDQLFTYHKLRASDTKEQNDFPLQISGAQVMENKINRLFKK